MSFADAKESVWNPALNRCPSSGFSAIVGRVTQKLERDFTGINQLLRHPNAHKPNKALPKRKEGIPPQRHM
jgi:hypothetical protein